MTASPSPATATVERPLTFCLFDGKRDVYPNVVTLTWDEFADWLDKRDVRTEPDGQIIGPYALRAGGRRCKEDVTAYSIVPFDFDSQKIVTPFASIKHVFSDFDFVCHATFKHDPPTEQHRFRLYLRLTRDITPKEVIRINEHFRSLLPDALDPCGASISQGFYAPASHPDRLQYAFYRRNLGRCFDPDRDLPPLESTETLRAPTTNETVVPFRLPNQVSDGQGRELAILKLAGHLRSRGVGEDVINHECLRFNAERVLPPLPTEVVLDRVSRYRTTENNITGGLSQKDGMEIEASIEPWVDDLNQQFAVLSSEGLIYALETRRPFEQQGFRLVLDNIKVKDFSCNPVRPRSVGKGSAWLRHPNRNTLKGLVLRSDEPRFTADGNLNLWRGYSVDPIVGDIRPFFWLLQRLIPNRKARRYFLRWIAHAVKHPGSKIRTAIVLWGLTHGSGKNLLIETIGSLFQADHFVVIGQAQLESTFNGWLLDKVLVLGDEVSSLDKRSQTNRLKAWVTGPTFICNEKGIKERIAENHANFIFVSNHFDALFLEDQDRRFFVCEVTSPKLTEAESDRFCAWRDLGGREALLHFLQTIKTDRTVFNPFAPAPETDAKTRMIESSRSDVERWLTDLVASDVEQLHGRVVVTSSELARAYRSSLGLYGPVVSPTVIVKAMKRLGLGYFRPSQVRLKSGAKVRGIALADVARWEAAPESAWAAEFQKPFSST